MSDYYDDEEYGENPFEGIQQEFTDVMLDRVVSYTCRKIATTRDRREFAEVYKTLASIPLRGILQLPKPLIDEFWKFVNEACQMDETDNASHGLRSLLNGVTASLCTEDEFQQDFHGLSSGDISDDYEERIRDLKTDLQQKSEQPAKWAMPLFRSQGKRLPRPKGEIEQTEDDKGES